jgi:hypothetical protein
LATKSVPTIETIDFDSDAEFDALLDVVLAEGQKRRRRNREEAIRMGIVDEHGNLLKTDLPPDMHEDSGMDFGG